MGAGVGVSAHTGGFTAMDAKGDFVACCGYSMRGGYVQPDAYMKVCGCACRCVYGGGGYVQPDAYMKVREFAGMRLHKALCAQRCMDVLACASICIHEGGGYVQPDAYIKVHEGGMCNQMRPTKCTRGVCATRCVHEGRCLDVQLDVYF